LQHWTGPGFAGVHPARCLRSGSGTNARGTNENKASDTGAKAAGSSYGDADRAKSSQTGRTGTGAGSRGNQVEVRRPHGTRRRQEPGGPGNACHD